jgi:DNA replication protein DnaC
MARDFDAAVVGGPKGTAALSWVQRKAAEAQERMDALAAAGKPFVPVYRRIESPEETLRGALNAAMDADWQAMTLDRFNGYTPELRASAADVAAYIEQPHGILYLTGDIGTGKTHLAAGAAVRLVERGYIVRVYRAADMAKRIRSASLEGAAVLEALMHKYKNVRVLVIDDFGAEHITDFLAAEWFDLLDYRYRQHAATIITSNVHPDNLGMPRLASRFQDGANATVVSLTAADYRMLPERPALGVAAADYAPPATVAASCPTCHGMGIVKRDLPVGHPDFGYAFRCPTCGDGTRIRNGGEK